MKTMTEVSKRSDARPEVGRSGLAAVARWCRTRRQTSQTKIPQGPFVLAGLKKRQLVPVIDSYGPNVQLLYVNYRLGPGSRVFC